MTVRPPADTAVAEGRPAAAGARFSRRFQLRSGQRRQADRHPCFHGFSRRRSGLEDQAGRALAVPRLFDIGEAQACLRGRTEGQRRQRPRALSARCRHHAQCRRHLRNRRHGHSRRMGGRNDAVRRDAVARYRRGIEDDRSIACDGRGRRDSAISRQGAARGRRKLACLHPTHHRTQYRKVSHRART